MARPLLSICFPELAGFGQPLSGEVAFRSELAKTCPLSIGYGLDVGLLIDCYLKYGIDAITEIDLGERTHNHQELPALLYQAGQVASTILLKAGVDLEGLPGELDAWSDLESQTNTCHSESYILPSPCDLSTDSKVILTDSKVAR